MSKRKIKQWGHKTKCKYHHGNTWPSVGSNTAIYDRVRMATWLFMKKLKYQHRDTLSSENINHRVHVQVWISTWGPMTRSEYQNEIHDQMCVSTW